MAAPLDGLALLQGYQANDQRAAMVPLQRQLIEMQLAEKQRAMGQDQQTQATLGRLGGAGPEQLGMALMSSNPDVGSRLLAMASQQRNQREQTAFDRERLAAQDRHQSARLSADDRYRNERLSLMAQQAANRPRPQGAVITTAEGLFERTAEGLKPLIGPDGKQLTPKSGEKPITEFQGKNAMYGSRALMADRTLKDLEGKISTLGLSMKQGLENLPFGGGTMGIIANAAISKEQQMVDQAQRNFVNALLRQESGATIQPHEFESAKKQYFAEPNDSPEKVEQKRLNRQLAIRGFKAIAGPAWTGVEEFLDKNQTRQGQPAETAPAQAPGGFSIRRLD